MGSFKFILVLLLIIQFSTPSICEFTIITPMKWTIGESNRVCVNLPWLATSEDELKISVNANFGESLLEPPSFPIPQGETSICNEYSIGQSLSVFGRLTIEGVLGGQKITRSKTILILQKPVNSIIQTDKDSYGPGQTLNFRILTFEGYSLNVATKGYDKIWIESPSNVVLAEWNMIPNEEGLVHMSTELPRDIKEGTYYIRVKYANQKIFSKSFEVNKYLSPSRIQISLRSEPFWLKGSGPIDVEVCARYRFGKPYTGTLNFEVYAREARIVEPPYTGGNPPVEPLGTKPKAESVREKREPKRDLHLLPDPEPWLIESNKPPLRCRGFNCRDNSQDKVQLSIYNYQHSKSFAVSGCRNVTLDISGIRISKKLRIEASLPYKKFIDETFFTEIAIPDRAITFKTQSNNNFKPELPATVTIFAQFTDDIPATNELMEICTEDENICKQVETDSEGALKVAVPPHLASRLVVKAMNYKAVNQSFYGTDIEVMPASTYNFEINRTDSSLYTTSFDIANDITNVNCDASSDNIQFDVPVLYAAFRENVTEINVQVISRGQLHLSTAIEQDLASESSLGLDDYIFMAPMEARMDVFRGSFKIPVTIPKSASSNAKLIVWYRDERHQELMFDSQILNIAQCPSQNAAHVSWRSPTSESGETATLSIKAAPNSICSISVVEKSVKPTSKDFSVSTLLEMTDNSTVHEYEDAFANRINECAKYNDRMRRNGVSGYRDSDKLINEAGLYIITDEAIKSMLCHHHHRIRGMRPSFHWNPLNYETVTVKTANDDKIPVHNYATWAWELVTIPDNGVFDFPLEVPEMLAEWQASALCVHPTKGVGVSNLASTTSVKDQFAELYVPYYPFILGDYMSITVQTFNYLNESLPVLLVPETKKGSIVPYEISSSDLKNESYCLSHGEIWSPNYSLKPTVAGIYEVAFSVYFDVPVDGCKISGRKPKKFELSTQIRVGL